MSLGRDGLGNVTSPARFAFDVSGTPESTGGTLDGAASIVDRYLGQGRHPAAATDTGVGVAYVEPGLGEAEVAFSFFDLTGTAQATASLLSGVPGAAPVTFSSPVLAGLSDGRYAAAWTGFNNDGDELGVGLALLDAAVAPVSFVSSGIVNQSVEFSQHSPDIVAVPDASGANVAVVAWVDDGAASGPELKVRRYSSALEPLEDEWALSSSEAHEGRPALSVFGAGWAAAWRESLLDGTEQLRVRAFEAGLTQTAVAEWSVPVLAAGGAEDTPALLPLDDTRLLALFTAGTDARGDGLYSTPRLQAALLDASVPGEALSFAVTPVAEPYASRPDIAQTHPNALRIEDRFYLAWRSSPTDDEGDASADEVWLKEIFYDPAAVATGMPASGIELDAAETRLPTGVALQKGDQRLPALAPVKSPTLPGGAIATFWDDYGATLGGSPGDSRAPRRDVSYTLYPSPLLNLPEVSELCSDVVDGCIVGEGQCLDDAHCQGELRCGFHRGPRFGYGRDVHVCVAAHCFNDMVDGDETAPDCGGSCGECAVCPPIEEAGGDHFCSALCPCDSLVGDCDTDEQCVPGAVCGVNNGADYGLAANRDACVPRGCEDITALNGELGHCAVGCPCELHEGHCLFDDECADGLACVLGVGVHYDFTPGTHVCLPATCKNGVLDAGEAQIDCGGPDCAPCPGCGLGSTPPACASTETGASLTNACDGCDDGEARQALMLSYGDKHPLTYANTEQFTDLSEGTLEFWFRSDNHIYSNRKPITLGQFAVNIHGYQLVDHTEKRGQVTCLTGMEYIRPHQFTSRTVTDGAWHHIACVRTATELRLYIDGVLEGSTPTGEGAPVLYPQGHPRTFPGINVYDYTTLDGAIDEVRLSAKAEYAGESFTPPHRLEPTCDTHILWHFDGDSLDYSGHGNHLHGPGVAPPSGYVEDDCYHGKVDPAVAPECPGVPYDRFWASDPLFPPVACTDPDTADDCDGCVSGETRTAQLLNENSHWSLPYHDPSKLNLDASTLDFWVKFNPSGSYESKHLAALGPFIVSMKSVANTSRNTKAYGPTCTVGDGVGSVLGVNYEITGAGLGADVPTLGDGQWHHIACVLRDLGSTHELQTFIDGKSEVVRTVVNRPTLRIAYHHGWSGFNVDWSTSSINGLLDEARLSNVARYPSTGFTPQHRFVSDCDTAVLLHFDGDLRDASGNGNHLIHPNWDLSSLDLFLEDDCHAPDPAAPQAEFFVEPRAVEDEIPELADPFLVNTPRAAIASPLPGEAVPPLADEVSFEVQP